MEAIGQLDRTAPNMRCSAQIHVKRLCVTPLALKVRRQSLGRKASALQAWRYSVGAKVLQRSNQCDK